MSAKAGKRWEREFANLIDDLDGWTAERVPRSVADATPVDDVVCVPREVPDDGDGHRLITRKLQRQELEYDEIIQVEVKHRSSGGFGMHTLRQAHLETIGLGTLQHLRWGDGWCTGGVEAWRYVLASGGRADHWERDDLPPKTARGAYEDKPNTDAVALHESGEPWVMLWRDD